MKIKNIVMKALIVLSASAVVLAGGTAILFVWSTSLVNDEKIPFHGDDNDVTRPTRLHARVMIFESDILMKPMYRDFVEGMGLVGNERVADFGSGSGLMSRFIAEKLSQGKGRVACIDISDTWIAVARKRLEQYGNVDFILGDITQLNLPASSFDRIAIHFVIHDIPPEIRAPIIGSLSRILKDGGKIHIREPLDARHGHGITAAEIQRLMGDNGLAMASSRDFTMRFMGPVYEAVFAKGR